MKAAGRAGEGAATADEVAAAAGVQAGVGWAAAAAAVCAPDLHSCCWTQRLPCLSMTASIDVTGISASMIATQHPFSDTAGSPVSCAFITIMMICSWHKCAMGCWQR